MTCKWIMALPILFASAAFAIGATSATTREKIAHPPIPDPIPVTTDCSAETPFGVPAVEGAKTICKTGYVSFYDTTLKQPRLVAYALTGDETFGCLGRYSFHIEPALEVVDGKIRNYLGASPSDFEKSKLDLGHMSPFEDQATTAARDYDSFSMANVSPQVPEFNRQGWESLEQDVRDWAYERHQVIVYVGPVFVSPLPWIAGKGIIDNGHLHTIGEHKVAVPDRFYKIVVDPQINQTIAFLMDNVATPKGPMDGFRTTIAEIEKETGITFPVPARVDKTAKADMWPIADHDWHEQHKKTCHTS